MHTIDPHEIERRAVLALVLEPIVEKEGCTTRSRDIDASLRLIDLQGAGVNVGKYFYELAERVNPDRSSRGALDPAFANAIRHSSPRQTAERSASNGVKREKRQPHIFYDLVYKALEDSTKNLKNKKFVNLGLIELLFPVVLSQLVYGGTGTQVLKNVKKILIESSPEDARYKEKMLSRAWSSSKKSAKRNYPEQIGGKNLWEHYEKNLETAKEHDLKTSVLWCEQILKSFPVAQKMHGVAKKKLRKGLIGALEEAYKRGFTQISKPGIIADYTAVVAYLLLSENPKASLI